MEGCYVQAERFERYPMKRDTYLLSGFPGDVIEMAMELLENALKISPDNAACRFYRARLLYEMHDYAQCLEELNDLKLIAHDEAQVFFLLGRVHKKLGDTHLALLNFSLAAEMDPRGEQSRNNFTDAPYDDEPSSPPSE